MYGACRPAAAAAAAFDRRGSAIHRFPSLPFPPSVHAAFSVAAVRRPSLLLPSLPPRLPFVRPSVHPVEIDGPRTLAVASSAGPGRPLSSRSSLAGRTFHRPAARRSPVRGPAGSCCQPGAPPPTRPSLLASSAAAVAEFR